ncbi:hypothetical protein [Bacteroides acidifaciens]|uniref:hypothetical protein n=1 Tax=Bacteroides acidifaciens TaxID=85831 RepID=UPI003F692D0F
MGGWPNGHVCYQRILNRVLNITYYWGSPDKAAIKTPDAWNKYMAEYAQKLRAPLAVVY